MDSRISIKGDFVSNTPFIDVVYNPSDDVRDDMVKVFAEKLEHTSAWCWLEWQPPSAQGGNFHFRIYPLTPEQLQMHIDRMTEALRVYKAHHDPRNAQDTKQ